MKLAVFYPNTEYASWNMGAGLCPVLKRMGHEALDCGIVTLQHPYDGYIEELKAALPSIETLAKFDAIIVAGPEHLGIWLEAVYGFDAWKKLTVPKLAWYHESVFREDRTITLDGDGKWCDEHFFPAAQDADFMGQEHLAGDRAHWLPHGVDTKMFCPGIENNVKLYGVAFTGLLYTKRQAYLQALAKYHHPPIHHGRIMVQDLGGYRVTDATRLLVQNNRQVKVLLNLPALSEVLVTRVTEALACGTFLITPALGPTKGADKNMVQFDDTVHLKYYRPIAVPELAEQLHYWLAHEDEREKVAAAGCAHVRKTATLELRMEEMLKTVSRAVAA